jgi:hypothetical protein
MRFNRPQKYGFLDPKIDAVAAQTVFRIPKYAYNPPITSR